MWILRICDVSAFGTVMVRIPFFMVAQTPSWLTPTGKVNLRSKLPSVRSEIRYLGSLIESMESFATAAAAAVAEYSGREASAIAGFSSVVTVPLSAGLESVCASLTVAFLKFV